MNRSRCRTIAPLSFVLILILDAAWQARAQGPQMPYPGMAPIEKQHPRPDVDRLFVPCREVMVQPGKQQLFDLRIAIGIGHAVERA